MHALEQHRADVQEVTGQDARRLSGQELPPGRRRRPPRRTSARAEEVGAAPMTASIRARQNGRRREC
jgi:hypothetical protein